MSNLLDSFRELSLTTSYHAFQLKFSEFQYSVLNSLQDGSLSRKDADSLVPLLEKQAALFSEFNSFFFSKLSID